MGFIDLINSALNLARQQITPQIVSPVPNQPLPTPTLTPFQALPEDQIVGKSFDSKGNIIPDAFGSPTPTKQTVNDAAQMAQNGGYMSIPGYSNGQVPNLMGNLVIQDAQKYNLNPAVLAGITQTENGAWNPNLKDTPVYRRDKAGNKILDANQQPIIDSWDRGPMQINSAAHPDVTAQQAYDPNFAVNYAAKLLSDYINQAGNLGQGIAAYNVGVGGATGVPAINPFGGGPKGQIYLNSVARNIDPQLLQQLDLASKLSPNYRTNPQDVVWPPNQ